jgi:4-aminobutyrate aminotransferase-like enzyme
MGLLIGLETDLDGGALNQVVKRGLKDGLILLQSGPEGNILGFSPPFGISDEEIDHLAGRLQEYFTSLPGSIS